jgi:uroporphyrinogen decarboxylase
MNPTERIIRTLEGKSVDRIPSWTPYIEPRTFQDVLGKPLISTERQLKNPLVKFLLNHWGPQITPYVITPQENNERINAVKAAIELGFDGLWVFYDESFTLTDSVTSAHAGGAIFQVYPDGYGNVTYMYKKPGITSREEFASWPYRLKADEVAHRGFKFFQKVLKKYSDKICICGNASSVGIHESLSWALGFERMAKWIRKEPDLVKQHIDDAEDLYIQTSMAMIDAGLKVIMVGDDLAFKTGPLMNPKQIDGLFGPSYTRIIKTIHDRGAKVIFHSCGDNTLLFDIFLKWGVDGLHAYELTSNVDIYKEKALRGDKVTIIGGIGVDYILTDRSTDEEVVEEVKKQIRLLGPGGRYIMAPVHGLPSVPGHKLKVMIDALKKYGNYPIAI